MIFFLLFDNWLILFDYCSDYTNLYSYRRTCNMSRTKSNDANAETERYIETVETKISNCST